ncbi:MAG: phosphatase PAP2 family protein [Chitinophagaceae bacterium]|nr:phosphatase PAP2 family protein [Chitinophagaceae bacterium]
MSVLEWLDKADRSLFTLIHADGAVPALDWLMLLLRKGSTWVPLYAFMLYWSIRNVRKYVLKFAILSLACAGLTDYISSSILKPFFGRLRPCYDEALAPVIRNIIGCAGKYGMPSGHATNHFGLACFWFFTILLMTGKKWYWLWAWAAAICYAQVYVGKHYPFDVVAGGCLGTVIGYLMYLLFRKWTLAELRLS